MKTHCLFLVSVLALGPIACGGTGDSASGGTTGAGGSGSTTSSGSNSTSGTGVGGGASTSSTSGTAATSSASGSGTTGAGGGNACSGYIDLTENNEVKMHFPSICMGSWGSNETMTAVGYHFAGGAAPGADEIDIHGCATTGAGSAGLLLRTPKVTAPGTFLDGDASYTDAAGVQLSSSADPYKIVITKLDPPGGVIEGTFDVTVTSPTDAKKTLVGSFHVCRVADENVP